MYLTVRDVGDPYVGISQRAFFSGDEADEKVSLRVVHCSGSKHFYLSVRPDTSICSLVGPDQEA
jgi:hypothetical protein